MLTPKEIAAEAVALLKAAKTKAVADGKTLTWTEVGAIIEGACTPKTPDASSKASDFGDRKKVPPTPEQVTAYSAFIGYPMDGQAWCDAYAAKGWKVGDHRMKDWQAAVRNWKTNGYGSDGVALAGTKKPTASKTYDRI
jgi:hypothetical protein